MISIHSPFNVNAQNSALSQSGNGESEQEAEQGQISTQNGRVVSGDNSVLSGNDLLCQDQDNSDSAVFDRFCGGTTSNSPPPEGQLISIVSIQISRSGTIPVDNWGSVRIQDPSANIDPQQEY